MISNGILQIALFTAVILLLAKPVGSFMAKVFEGQRTFLHRVLRPIEIGIYRICGIDETAEQHWTRYAGALLIFSLVTLLLTYLLQRIQQWLPLNPQGLGNVAPDLSFNTAVSFTTNTNWQFYTPETTMSYLTQMVGLATHNFFSAAAGIAVAIAVVRGFARHSAQTLGNFWVDFTRGTLYILLPISLVAALLLCSQGVIQNFHPYAKAATVEGAVQTIPQGPVASQEAIKMLGTNGGGFFNANSAHPYENPTPFSNFLQMVLIFVIPAGLTYTFGKMVRDTRQGWALLAAMTILFLAGVAVVYHAEQAGNPILAKLGVAPAATWRARKSGSALPNSALFAVITTDASCGAVNNVHDSLTPLGGLVPTGQYRTRRSHFRRCGIGPLRHAAVRDAGGVHRRADGGPHTGVPGQEDRAERSQDDDALGAGAGRSQSWHSRRGASIFRGLSPANRTTARTGCRRCSMRFRARPAITAAPSRG